MIHKIAFKNFNSFKEVGEVDFTVDKNAPETDAYFTDFEGNRISKVMTVVGANASGKTNLLKSIIFLKWFIVHSFSKGNPKDDINGGFDGFLFCSENSTSSLEITFEIIDEIYRYELELTKKQVVKELLEIKNKETKRWNIVFSRQLKDSGDDYDADFPRLNVSSDFKKIVRHNSSVLSAAKQIDNPQAIKIVDYFSKIVSNFEDISSTKRNDVGSILTAAEFFQNNPKAKERAEKILQRFDLGISRFEITKYDNPGGGTVYIPLVFHQHSDNDHESSLMMFRESSGTQNLFVLLPEIFTVLESGNMVIFDELDNNLHPLMIPEIISLFKSNKHNPKNAQIFFSTHNVQILNELDKQQIVLVEKNKNISEAWKLSDIEGVRTDDNYYAKYLAGAYGAIPKF